MERRLYRSRTDRMIFGVCGGLADYFDIDPTIMRVVFVALAFLNGVGILAYVILAIVLPEGAEARRGPRAAGQAEEGPAEGYVEPEPRRTREGARNLAALILIALGFVFLLANLGYLWWLNFNMVWPLILVAIGLALLFGRGRR